MSDAPKKAAKPRKPKAPAAHPPSRTMITAAIESLKERNGSSFAAIKKYVAANYKFDVEKQGHVLKRSLKSMVVGGTLIQTKGTGASGSFKISVAAKKAAKPKKPKVKKAAKPKKPKVKKAAKPKKPKAKKSPKKAKKPAAKKAKPAKKPAAKKAKPAKKAAKKPAKKAAKKPAKKAAKK
ncbi:late histone H1-like [Branchiostoma floridae]|uniref:Late histone H1-like n=2 Tax=Branchiostoma floridae TaxID=7739 RepID=A0A9J7M6Q1_BRAFL|nr:late histone H1-like [Branchiostoma floridae]